MAKYNNATTEYDNKIEPSKKKGELLSSLKSSLSSALNTISGGSFTKLNELTSKFKGFDLNSYIDKLGNKISGAYSAFLDNATAMIKDMLTDSLAQLKNAGKNFALNIVEQFVDDVKASVYIEDAVFAQTIRALYYAGADLAYNNHYIRQNALSRDWVHTLKFLDQEYNINYTADYNKLESDLTTASRNGCYKNIKYIFEKMMSGRNTVIAQLSSINASLAALTYDSTRTQALLKTRDELTRTRDKYDKLFVKIVRELIIYSYSSLNASDLKGIMRDTYGIVLPRYFGSTDNKYNGQFMFTATDINRMMPAFKQHQLSKTDYKTMEELSDQLENVKDESDELRDLAKFTDDYANVTETALNTEGTSINRFAGKSKIHNDIVETSIAAMRTETKIEEFRATYRSGQASEGRALSVASLRKGSSKVAEDTRARYNKNYDGSSVKFRPHFNDAIDSALTEKSEYITLRNNNIKSIYILLSSTAIYGNDCMVNETFYKRCNQKTMNTLRSSFDKARGLMGASSIAQTLYDLSEVVEGSAYSYTKKVENFLYDPKVNNELVSGIVSGDFSGFNSLEFDSNTNQLKLPVYDKDTGTVVNTTNIEEAIKDPNNFQPPTSSSTVTNTKTEEEIEKIMDADIVRKKKIIDITRYTEKMPIGTKRDILVKYLSRFYNSLLKRSISNDISVKCLSNLVFKIIGRSDITSTGQLEDLFVNSTNNTLSNNIKLFVSIDALDLCDTYLNLSSYDYNIRNDVKNIFSITVYAMIMEIKSVSFAKAAFVYDNVYIKTIVKQRYESELKQLKNIDQIKDKSSFWAQKDIMTSNYEGFDRNGIFGVDERDGFRIKYTNVITGDWNSISVAEDGTFFGGSNNTKNNGLRYLDDASGIIRKTSKTSGNWDIFVKINRSFFKNEFGDLYIWNSGTKDVDKVLNKTANNYEYKEFKDYNLLFALGKNNNGLMIFKNDTFQIIHNVGSNWEYFTDKNKIFFYSTSGLCPIIAVDISSGNFSKTTNINASFTTPVTFTVKHEVRITVTTSISSNLPPVTKNETQILYRHHILLAYTNTAGIYDLVNESTEENTYSENWTMSNSLIVNGKLHLADLNDKIYAIPENSEEGSFIIKPIYNKLYSSNTDITNLSQYIQTNSLNNEYQPVEKLEMYNNASVFQYIKGNLCFMTGTSTSGRIAVSYVHKKGSDFIERTNITAIDPKNIVLYSPDSDDDILIFARNIVTNDLFYCDRATNNVITLLNDPKYKVSDWEYIKINDRYAQLYSPSSDFGILIYDCMTNKIINTNINTGKWKVCEGHRYYYALSQDGTNLGVRYAKKSGFLFSDISEQDVRRYDIKAFAYDSSKKRTYFGIERSKCSLNIDLIKYDINEYIYLNNVYQLYKDIEKNMDDKTNDLLNQIDNKLSGIDPSLLILVNETERASGPVNGTEYFVKNDNSDDYISAGRALTSFDPDENYYRYSTDTEMLSTDEINENIKKTWDPYVNSLDEIEKSSPFYTDMLTASLANTEFNVNDKNKLNDIQLDLILGDDGRNSKAYLVLEGDNMTYQIKNEDSRNRNLDPGSKNWNIVNEYTSTDFLNADEDDVSNIK